MKVLSIKPLSYIEYFSGFNYAMENNADLIEVRVEDISNLEFEKIISHKYKKRIITYLISEGSALSRENAYYRYSMAIKNRVNYIDIDERYGKEFFKSLKNPKSNTKFIVSYHNYNLTPGVSTLIKLLKKLMTYDADVIKIVCKANTIEDNAKVIELLQYARENKINLIAHCMGEAGKACRILFGKFGSYFVYTAMEGAETAEGQIELSKINRHFNFNKLNSNTKVFGIIGNPLKYSRSWLFHNYAYKEIGLNNLFLNFEVQNLNSFLKVFSKYLTGLSITIPYKEKIIAQECIQSREVKKLKAANTLIFRNNKKYLYNTDYLGFEQLVKKNKDLRSKNILVIGAGGSARSIILGLLNYNNKVTVANRTPDRVRQLMKEFKINQFDEKDISHFDVIINTTPGDNEFLINTSIKVLTSSKIKLVIDIALHNIVTDLLILAIRRKISFINGFEFFVYQAKEQFLLMNNKKIRNSNADRFLVSNYSVLF